MALRGSARDPWETVVRRKWMDLRVKLNPSELRHPLLQAKLITEAEYHELDPTMGVGRPTLNDRLYQALSYSGKRGFEDFVRVLQQCGPRYAEVLVSLGQDPGPDTNHDVTVTAERDSHEHSSSVLKPSQPRETTFKSGGFDSSVGDPGPEPTPTRPVIESKQNVWEEIIRQHSEVLQSTLLPEDLASECYKQGLISHEVFDILNMSEWTKQKRNRKFLDALSATGKPGLLVFYNVLKSKGFQCAAVREILEPYVKDP